MLRTGWVVLHLLEGSQSVPVGGRLGKFDGVLFENLENIFAYVAAFLAEFVVHPESLTADVNPAVALEVG